MKLNNSLKVALVTSLGASIIGCSAKNNSAATQVTSTFKMTGSGATATVAINKKPSLWAVFINTAYAMIPSTLVDSTEATVNLTSAWIALKEVKFKSEDTVESEDNQTEAEFKGPYFVNLLSNTPVALDTKAINQKSIQKIKIKLEASQASLPSDTPTELANNSIYIAGSVGGNNFTFQLNDESEILIAGHHSFLPIENSELLVEIQLANIFKQINMSSIINNEVIDHSHKHSGENLCQSIDASARDLYSCVLKGLEKHADFGEDHNGDGSLENNEDHTK